MIKFFLSLIALCLVYAGAKARLKVVETGFVAI